MRTPSAAPTTRGWVNHTVASVWPRARGIMQPGPGSLMVGALLMISAFAACSSPPDPPPELMASEVGSFPFRPGVGPHPDTSIPVWYARPPDGTELADPPVLVVMPGRGRNGEEYRDDWLGLAQSEGVVLVVPELPLELYSRAQYNLGHLVDEAGEPVAADQRTFAVIETLYDQVRDDLALPDGGYQLYGHSAGAQFAHRFAFFADDPSLVGVVAANAGWYTMPDVEVTFPHGLGGAPLELADEALIGLVATRLTVLLGSEDNDPEASGLQRDELTSLQGDTRLDRGFEFFRRGRDMAQAQGVPLAWTIEVVPGAGHDNAEMAGVAATILFNR